MKPAAQTGKVSLAFQKPVYIQSAASIVGKKKAKDRSETVLIW